MNIIDEKSGLRFFNQFFIKAVSKYSEKSEEEILESLKKDIETQGVYYYVYPKEPKSYMSVGCIIGPPAKEDIESMKIQKIEKLYFSDFETFKDKCNELKIKIQNF